MKVSKKALKEWYLSYFGIDSQSRFRLVTTGKILFTTVASVVALFLLLWLVLELDFLFFQSFEINGQIAFKNTFYDYISNKMLMITPYVIVFFIILIVLGMYTSNLMLRPFKQISTFCRTFADDPENAQYDPDFFSDLKLLTRFSEFFFIRVKDMLEDREKVEIPDRYKKFHTPIFEAGFFFQSSFFIFITAVLSFLGSHRILIEVHESLVTLADHTLNSEKEIIEFLSAQGQIFDSITWIVCVIHIVLNIFLVFNLYSQVSKPAFGVFATMRSFLRGNRKARIHLLGNYYLRSETKEINAFLSELEKKLTKN
jgi:hypothetical protein